ncbi:MAG TPA: LacI family DNA-binding transcriptional regulator [Casimicrobiaceae bacterium]|nr:LacI family DNA-binding transcriptional regulator [Casimicrobiaceae bacterium]
MPATAPPRPARRRRRPTIEDVARRAGVSVGTVSNVLNERGNVRPGREALVRDAIAALAYVPNGVAQSLRRQRSRVVGLCAPLTSSAYFAALLDAFEDIAAAQGYEVMQVLSRQDPALELRRIRALLARKVDGLIVIPSVDPRGAFDLIAASGTPAVIVDRLHDDRRFDYVTMDDHGAMTQAVRALLEHGHRRLLYVFRYPSLPTTRRRIEAFRAALARVAGTSAQVLVRDASDAVFATQVRAALAPRTRPTAIVASNSALTLALLRVLRDLGLSVPADVSLVSFDAPDWAEVLETPLAVVRPPTAEIARRAWELLLKRMREPDRPVERVQLPAALEMRASVARRRSPR